MRVRIIENLQVLARISKNLKEQENMTKKELLESEFFKMAPDDAEIVFRTNERMNLCCKLKAEHLSLRKQCVNVKEVQEGTFYKFRNPQYMTAVVIEGIPFDYMESMFNMHFEIEE